MKIRSKFKKIKCKKTREITLPSIDRSISETCCGKGGGGLNKFSEIYLISFGSSCANSLMEGSTQLDLAKAKRPKRVSKFISLVITKPYDTEDRAM